MNSITIVESVTDSNGVSHEVEIATLVVTPCGELVEQGCNCNKSPSCYSKDCVAGRNLLSEIL